MYSFAFFVFKCGKNITGASDPTNLSLHHYKKAVSRKITTTGLRKLVYVGRCEGSIIYALLRISVKLI